MGPHDNGETVGLPPLPGDSVVPVGRLEAVQAQLDAMSDDVLDKSTAGLARDISIAQTRLALQVREVERRTIPESTYGLSTTGWLKHIAAMTASEASGTVKTARALADMPTITDKALAGEIPQRTVTLLAQAMDRHRNEFPSHEAVFADVATYLSVGDMRRAIGHWEQQINYDQALTDAKKLEQLRGLYLHQTMDGLWATTATFTAEGGHLIKQAIDGICDPQNLDATELRSPAQRRADAVVDICSFWLDHNTEAVTSGGEKPHVIITMDYEILTGHIKRLPEIGGASVTPHTARRITCDAAIIPIVLGSDSEPLDVGRKTRTIPTALRRAIELRDNHCTWTGCTAPPSWCDVHHIQHWANGGATSLTNCRLLCRRHHTATHDLEPPDT
jgi:hypothetical protein